MLLNARYRVVRKLGEGGEGEIFVARDIEIGRDVAIKLQPARTFESLATYADYGRYIDQEYRRMWDVLEVRGIPRIFDRGTFGRSDRQFLVMELVEGVTVAEWIADHEPVSALDAVSVIGQLCEILGRLHSKGYVHRDVTPNNTMIQYDGCVRLLDVGISVRAGGLNTAPGGSPGYAAPEQYDREAELTPQVDVFALGALLFRMVTGQLPYHPVEYPFDGTERAFPAGLRAVMPDALRSLGLAMVSLNPLERPRGVDELYGYLRPMLPELGSAASSKVTKPDPTAYYRRGLWRT
ncbi:serine/threonine-protein kinase [Kitasatospora sp. NPDC059747]|uniref:serine/threonine-protein kinase n=1 Tax=Kitasatospora sp. NPDC059747 TaxID=3346930 RepID=UPI00365DC5B6